MRRVPAPSCSGADGEGQMRKGRRGHVGDGHTTRGAVSSTDGIKGPSLRRHDGPRAGQGGVPDAQCWGPGDRTPGGQGHRRSPAGAGGGEGAALQSPRFGFKRSDTLASFQGGINFFGKINVNDLRRSSFSTGSAHWSTRRTLPPRGKVPAGPSVWRARPNSSRPPSPSPVHRRPRHNVPLVSVATRGGSCLVRAPASPAAD